MKRDRNFRLNKETKRIMQTIVDRFERSQYKNLMIDAQISSENAIRASKKSKEQTSE